MGQLTMNTKEKMEYRQQCLDEYEAKLGIPSNLPPGTEDELQKYLTMDRVSIESLDSQSSLAISARLTQFSIYLQRCVNKELSRIKWAKTEITIATAEEMKEMSTFLPYDTRVAMLAKENLVVSELFKILNYAEERVARLADLASGIKNLGYVMSLKRGSTYEHNRQSG